MFSKYILIGVSAMVLLANVTQAAACDPNGGVDPNTWSLIEEYECEPGNPGVKAHKWACFGDDGTPWAIKYTDGVSDTDKCPLPDQPAPAETTSQWECERALARGENVCNDNVIYCENSTDGSRNSMMVVKHEGACNPYSGERDWRGCIFQYQKNDPQPLFCSERGQQPQQPAQQPAQQVQQVQQVQQIQQVQQPAQEATATCYVCDNNVWRVSGVMTAAQCARISNSGWNQPQSPSWCAPAQPAPPAPPTPPTPPAPPAPPAPAQGGDIDITNTNTNTNTNTITNNVTREIVREMQVPRVVLAAAPAQPAVVAGVQYVPAQLPKTGLPAFTWAALAFIPAGFGLRRFRSLKRALENHPSFIWEDRQFKS